MLGKKLAILWKKNWKFKCFIYLYFIERVFSLKYLRQYKHRGVGLCK